MDELGSFSKMVNVSADELSKRKNSINALNPLYPPSSRTTSGGGGGNIGASSNDAINNPNRRKSSLKLNLGGGSGSVGVLNSVSGNKVPTSTVSQINSSSARSNRRTGSGHSISSQQQKSHPSLSNLDFGGSGGGARNAAEESLLITSVYPLQLERKMSNAMNLTGGSGGSLLNASATTNIPAAAGVGRNNKRMSFPEGAFTHLQQKEKDSSSLPSLSEVVKKVKDKQKEVSAQNSIVSSPKAARSRR